MTKPKKLREHRIPALAGHMAALHANLSAVIQSLGGLGVSAGSDEATFYAHVWPRPARQNTQNAMPPFAAK